MSRPQPSVQARPTCVVPEKSVVSVVGKRATCRRGSRSSHVPVVLVVALFFVLASPSLAATATASPRSCDKYFGCSASVRFEAETPPLPGSRRMSAPMTSMAVRRASGVVRALLLPGLMSARRPGS